MKFTKETLKRTIRTFIQAFIPALIIGTQTIDFSEDKATLKSVMITIVIPAIAAGLSAVMNLEKPSEEKGGGSLLTFNEWVKKYNGKKLDPDGVSGVQCVDLIKHYCRNVIGVDKPYSESWGNAITWYEDFSKKPWLTENFKRIPYEKGMRIRKGDIAVFKTSSKYGHIAVCSGIYNDEGFSAYDQNYNGTHAGMTLRVFAYSDGRKLLGVLRPKDQRSIVSPPSIKPGTYKLTNVRGIYNGYGQKTNRKKVKELPEAVKKNCTSQKKNAEAFLFAGTKVKITETKLLKSGNLWAKIPGGYICIWHGEDGKKFIK